MTSMIKDTRGANLVEYIILVGVVALMSIAAFRAFQGQVWNKSTKQGEVVTNVITNK